MQTWHSYPLYVFLIICCIRIRKIDANIFHSVLGVPSECVHNNIVRPCKLSFSCWIQGGKHVIGCGDNKWLFSCCVPQEDELPMSIAEPMYNGFSTILTKSNYYEHERPARFAMKKTNPKLVHPSKQNILRRRIDDEPLEGNYSECGVPRTAQNTIQKRIIGGRIAQFAEYPWQVHIRIAEYQCGGILVSKSFIVTAAHCIETARIKDIIVYLGEHDTQNSGAIMEPLPSEKHYVIRKFIHPRFQFRVTQPDRFDLALLQLAIPTTFTKHILPICLPSSPIDLTNRRGIIAGWGKTDLSLGHTGTAILQTASVPIISARDCLSWHEKKSIYVELYDEMFCAGYPDGKQDACLGDSGGGIILLENGKFILVGITSAGFGCGVDHQPGIYHNVQKTAKWIQSVIKKDLN